MLPSATVSLKPSRTQIPLETASASAEKQCVAVARTIDKAAIARAFIIQLGERTTFRDRCK